MRSVSSIPRGDASKASKASLDAQYAAFGERRHLEKLIAKFIARHPRGVELAEVHSQDPDHLLTAGTSAMAEKYPYWRPDDFGTLLLSYARQHVWRALQHAAKELLVLPLDENAEDFLAEEESGDPAGEFDPDLSTECACECGASLDGKRQGALYVNNAHGCATRAQWTRRRRRRSLSPWPSAS
jgi:hypothetical protein